MTAVSAACLKEVLAYGKATSSATRSRAKERATKMERNGKLTPAHASHIRKKANRLLGK